jgi:phage baseplate assembly protein V
MALTAEDLAQISQHLVRLVAVRVANLAARATVQLVDDSGQLQTLQIGGIHGGPYDGCEHLQPYGISGVPPAGSEAIVIFPNGDRLHPLVFAVGDRGTRPGGREPGEFTIYNGLTGAKIVMTKDGDIVATPAPGRKMLIHDAGTAVPLATKADLAALATFVQGMTLPVAGATAGPPAPATVPTPTGTTVLEAQ